MDPVSKRLTIKKFGINTYWTKYCKMYWNSRTAYESNESETWLNLHNASILVMLSNIAVLGLVCTGSRTQFKFKFKKIFGLALIWAVYLSPKGTLPPCRWSTSLPTVPPVSDNLKKVESISNVPLTDNDSALNHLVVCYPSSMPLLILSWPSSITS